MRATMYSLALAAALAFTGGNAVAQHHGGGHMGGHAGGSHGGAPVGHYAYYGHPNNHGGWGYWPYVAGGYLLGSALSGWGSPGYYYMGPGYDYATPAYGYYSPPVYGVTTAGYTTTDVAVPNQTVLMTIELPKADAQVFLNDVATTSTGAERVFQSPPLDPGTNYKYTVRAQWMEDGKRVEQKREVPVKAGQSVTVDFRQPAREQVAPPEIK